MTAVFRLTVTELGPFPASVTPAVRLSGFTESAGSARAEPLEAEFSLDCPLEPVEFSIPLGSLSLGDLQPIDSEESILDRISSKRLWLQVVDVANSEQPLFDQALAIDLRPVLHDASEIKIEGHELSLENNVALLWEEPVADPTEEEPERTRTRSRKPTLISVCVESLIAGEDEAEPPQRAPLGPPENEKSSNWNVLEFGFLGIENLPTEIADFKNEATGDPWLEYEVQLWSHKFAGKKVVEQIPNAAYTPGTEEEPETLPRHVIRCAGEEALAEEETRNSSLDSRLAGASGKAKYVGPKFLSNLKTALNLTGGTWVLVTPKTIVSADPKAPAAPAEEAERLKSKYTRRAWLDLRGLLSRGSRTVVEDCVLKEFLLNSAEQSGEEKPMSIQCFMRLAKPVVASEEEPAPKLEDMLKFGSQEGRAKVKQDKQKLPDSLAVCHQFMAAVARCVETLHEEHNRLVEEAKKY